MKTINKSLLSILESAIKDSLKKYESCNEGSSLGDLYLFFDKEDESLLFYDDLEQFLHKVRLDKEDDTDCNDWIRQIKYSLKPVLQNLEKEGFFNKEFIYKPFAVSIVDEDFIVTDELIFIDDNTLKLDNDLLSNLDEDLDSFLKELLK